MRPIRPLPEDEWPDDLPAYVFLGRAIKCYGRIVHQSEWSGTETPLDVGDAWSRHGKQSLSATQQKLADQLFEEIWPSEELWEIGDWEDHHWQTVVEQQWRLVAANRRWKATSQALITDFRAGRIKTFSRDREGGSLKPVEPHDWNFENWHRRMIEFDIDPSDPFETESESSRMDVRTLRYLYVDREDIDRLAGSWSADMPTPAQWAALSPYLHFAVAAATTIGAGILKTGTRKDIVARLNALNVPKPPHGTEAHKADEIASVIRFPESEKAGRRPIKKTP